MLRFSRPRFHSSSSSSSSATSSLSSFSKELPISTLVARAQNLLHHQQNYTSDKIASDVTGKTRQSDSNSLSSSSSSTTRTSSTTTTSSSSRTMIEAKKCLEEVYEETKSQRLKILISSLNDAIELQKIKEGKQQKNNKNNENNSNAPSAKRRKSNHFYYFQSVVPVATLTSVSASSSSLTIMTKEFQSHLERGFFVQSSSSSLMTIATKEQQEVKSHLQVWNALLKERYQQQIASFPDFLRFIKTCPSETPFSLGQQEQEEIALYASAVLFLNDFIDHYYFDQQHHQNIMSVTAKQNTNSTSEDSSTLLSVQEVLGHEIATRSTTSTMDEDDDDRVATAVFDICTSIIKRAFFHKGTKRSGPLLGLIKTTTSLLYKIISSNTKKNQQQQQLLAFAPYLSLLVAMFKTSIFPQEVVSSCVLDVDFLISEFLPGVMMTKNSRDDGSASCSRSWVIQHIIEEIAHDTISSSSSSFLPIPTVHERLLEALLRQVKETTTQRNNNSISRHNNNNDAEIVPELFKISVDDLSRVFDPVILNQLQQYYYSHNTNNINHNEDDDHFHNHHPLQKLLLSSSSSTKSLIPTICKARPEWTLWFDTMVPFAYRHDINGYRMFLSQFVENDRAQQEQQQQQLTSSSSSVLPEAYQRRLAALIGKSSPSSSEENNNNNARSLSSSWRQALLLYSAVTGSTFSNENQSVFYNHRHHTNYNNNNKINYEDDGHLVDHPKAPSSLSSLPSPLHHRQQHQQFIRQVAAVCTIEALHQSLLLVNKQREDQPQQTNQQQPNHHHVPSHVPIRLAQSLLSSSSSSSQQDHQHQQQPLTASVAAQLLRISCVNGEWNSALQLHESFSKYFSERRRKKQSVVLSSPSLLKDKNTKKVDDESVENDRHTQQATTTISKKKKKYWFDEDTNYENLIVDERMSITTSEAVNMNDETTTNNNNNPHRISHDRKFVKNINSALAQNSSGRKTIQSLLHTRPLQQHQQQQQYRVHHGDLSEVDVNNTNNIFNDDQYKSIVRSIADHASRTTQIAAKVSSVARHSMNGNWRGVLAAFHQQEQQQHNQQQFEVNNGDDENISSSSISSSRMVEDLIKTIKKRHVTTSVAYACLATGRWQHAFQILSAASSSKSSSSSSSSRPNSSSNNIVFLLSQPRQWLYVAKKYSPDMPKDAVIALEKMLSLDDDDGNKSDSQSRTRRTMLEKERVIVEGMSDDFDVETDFINKLRQGPASSSTTSATIMGSRNKNNSSSSMSALRRRLDSVASSRYQQQQKDQQKQQQESSRYANHQLPTKVTAKLRSLKRTTTLIRAASTSSMMMTTMFSSSDHRSDHNNATSIGNNNNNNNSTNEYFEALRNIHRPSGEAFAQCLRNQGRGSRSGGGLEQQETNHTSTRTFTPSSSSAAAAWMDAIELFQDAYLASGRNQLRSDVYLGTLEHLVVDVEEGGTNTSTTKTQEEEINHHHNIDDSENTKALQKSTSTSSISSSSSPPPEIIKSLVNVTKNSPAFHLDPRVSTALIRTAAAAHLWSDVIDCFFILLDTSSRTVAAVPDKTSVAVVLTACKEIDGKCDRMLSEVKAYLETTLEDSFALLGDALQHVKWFRSSASTTIVTMEVRASEYGRVQNSTVAATSSSISNNNSSRRRAPPHLEGDVVEHPRRSRRSSGPVRELTS